MATIKLNNTQLKLIQRALDFYSRVGALQFDEILSHPTIENAIYTQFSPKKEFEVGDQTMRGEIVEIGKDYIKTKGHWSGKEEVKTWTDVENIKFSPDWVELHHTKYKVKETFNNIKKEITGKDFGNGSFGLYNKEVDNSCREAFDMIQVIRHEFWKENPKRSNVTVDSSLSLSDPESAIKVETDNIRDIRREKLKKLKNI